MGIANDAGGAVVASQIKYRPGEAAVISFVLGRLGTGESLIVSSLLMRLQHRLQRGIAELARGRRGAPLGR